MRPHRGSPGSISGQSVWAVWLTKWHKDRFYFPSAPTFPVCSYRSSNAPYLVIHLLPILYNNVVDMSLNDTPEKNSDT